MPTKIKLDFSEFFTQHTFRSYSSEKKENDIPFTEAFCEEDPEEVLRALGKRFHIDGYKGIHAQRTKNEVTGDTTLTGNAILNGEREIPYTMNILTPEPQAKGTSIEGKLKDIDFGWIEDITRKQDYEACVDRIISYSFIKTEKPPFDLSDKTRARDRRGTERPKDGGQLSRGGTRRRKERDAAARPHRVREDHAR